MSRAHSTDELLRTEQRRVESYRLLTQGYREPDRELFETIEDSANDLYDFDLERLASAMPESVETARVDFAKLFVGPFEMRAPPYGSVYLDRTDRVMTESTRDVRAAYRREGLEVTLDEPADHLAAELEFLYVLVVTEGEALDSGDEDAAIQYLDRQYEFLSEHLGRWVSEFAAEVREHAETEFYWVLADETQRFLEADVDRLADRRDRIRTDDAGLVEVVIDEN